MTQRVERKVIKTVYDSPQSSMTGLALQMEKVLDLRISHEHKYSSRVSCASNGNYVLRQTLGP